MSSSSIGDTAHPAIADNAMGISPQIQQKIFDPFFTTKPMGKGTGMGMSISYQMITERHSGHFKCDSTVGKGTTFLIQLPLRQTNVRRISTPVNDQTSQAIASVIH